MPLNKQSGNMYPWVTHTWNPIRGKCPHDCIYCYMKRWFDVGDLRLVESELNLNLGNGKTIFVGSATDMFADAIQLEWIERVLEHCSKHGDNTYLFQSKNPEAFGKFSFPQSTILATTIETNRDYSLSFAPLVSRRVEAMRSIVCSRKMVSIEPLLDFDLSQFLGMIIDIRPSFVSIGADSQHHRLPEPPRSKIIELVNQLKRVIEVKIKTNLNRLIKSEAIR